MAYAQTLALITRVREICESNAGFIRRIPEDKYTGDFHTELTQDEQTKRATTGPRFDVNLGAMKRNPASPSSLGNKHLLDIEISVTIARDLWLGHQLTDKRDEQFALSVQDGDVLRQALEYTGNLDETEAGDPTGLCSGCLQWIGSDAPTVKYAAAGGGVISTVHRFKGIVLVTITSAVFIPDQDGNFPDEA